MHGSCGDEGNPGKRNDEDLVVTTTGEMRDNRANDSEGDMAESSVEVVLGGTVVVLVVGGDVQ